MMTADLVGTRRRPRGGDEEDEQLATVQLRADAGKCEAVVSAGGCVSLLGEPELCTGQSPASMRAELSRVPSAEPCRLRSRLTGSPVYASNRPGNKA